MYGRLRRGIGQILRDLCRQKDIERVEGKAMPDHIPMLLSVPPRYSIAMTIGYLKGKSATRIHRELLHTIRDAVRPELLGTGLRREHRRSGRSPDPTIHP
jgi:putative transposase